MDCPKCGRSNAYQPMFGPAECLNKNCDNFSEKHFMAEMGVDQPSNGWEDEKTPVSNDLDAGIDDFLRTLEGSSFKKGSHLRSLGLFVLVAGSF